MFLSRIAVLGSLVLAPVALSAQTPTVPLKPDSPSLLAKVKITDAAAREAALAKVPGGSIVEAGLEKEHGKLIYSYDVKVAGKDGIDEVAVDAITGKVLSVDHESSAAEAKEAAADAKEAAAKKAASAAKKKTP